MASVVAAVGCVVLCGDVSLFGSPMSKSRAKGTSAETALVNYLRANGFPYARRLALAGARDCGDVSLGDGISVVIEVKNTAAPNWAVEWDETVVEQVNAGAAVGVLVRKRRGKGDPAGWYAMVDVQQMASLLRRLHDCERGHER